MTAYLDKSESIGVVVAVVDRPIKDAFIPSGWPESVVAKEQGRQGGCNAWLRSLTTVERVLFRVAEECEGIGDDGLLTGLVEELMELTETEREEVLWEIGRRAR